MGRVEQSLVVFDSPADGYWNMSVDEAILRDTADQCVLRFYEWTPATLSLGYFQKTHDRNDHKDSRDTPMVRRSTGGGAILHDKELTYSLTVPHDHEAARQPQALYGQMHRSITRAMADWKVELSRCVENRMVDHNLAGEDKPFLCFQAQTPGDLLYAGDKIVGSAQRRRREGVLQHGSILLQASEYATQLPGIYDLCGVRICPKELALAIAEQMLKFARFERGKLSDKVLATARQLSSQRFATDGWNHKR